jgi:hypothetical protein
VARSCQDEAYEPGQGRDEPSTDLARCLSIDDGAVLKIHTIAVHRIEAQIERVLSAA